MIVGKDTTIEEFAKVADIMRDGEEGRLCETAEKVFVPEGWWSVKIEDFFAMLKGDFSSVGIEVDDKRVLAVYLIRAFQGFMAQFFQTLKNLTPPKTIPTASNLCMPVNIDEGMLVFVRRYFNLPSFEQASKVTLGEFLIAKRDDYNRAMVQIATANYYKTKRDRK